MSFFDQRDQGVHALVACYIQDRWLKSTMGIQSLQLLYSIPCRALRSSGDQNRAGRFPLGKHLSYAEPDTPVSTSDQYDWSHLADVDVCFAACCEYEILVLWHELVCYTKMSSRASGQEITVP